ncbi:MAG TPA: hypothetical protein HA326_00500, partial [Thermoplasmata archaeon]|nr:hypothetical protein [Thermoplasmata archaeon]
HLDPTDLAFLSILLEMEKELETLRTRRERSFAPEGSAAREPPRDED